MENAMHKLGVFMAVVALLFVAPVLAQEMGGATGPGSSRGLEAAYATRQGVAREFMTPPPLSEG
jgi:hypothetical protein